MRRPNRSNGFTLLEVIFAVGITATALLALQATCSGAILSAADSIRRRAARSMARSKLEEIIVGVVNPDEGGSFEDNPEFTWTATSEELGIGMPDSGTEKVLVVKLEVSFPIETGETGRDTLTLTTIVAAESENPGAAAGS
jgi:hypothetical protein